jgi:hypothetical protein
MNRYQKAHKVFEAYMQQLGATREEGQAYQWSLNTPLGRMDFSMHSEDLSIYARFDDVEKAKKHLSDMRLNRYSGKWNWHGLTNKSDPFEALKLELDAIMAMKSEDSTLLAA